MPLRPREHELDDEAELAFRAALPTAWVFRTIDRHDYGIDGNVEIFENQRPTGEVFNVQLKGTDAADDGKSSKARVKVDTGEYWSLLQLPTLVVRFHSPSGNLYARWWHHHSFELSRGQETLTFTFEARHKWSEVTPAALVEEIRAYHMLRSARLELPLRIHAVSRGEQLHGVPVDVIIIALRSAAERLPRLVEVRTDPPPPGAATITFSDDRTGVDLGGVGVVLHHDIPYGDRRPVDNIGFDSLVGISLALGRIGLASAAASIANVALRSSTLAAGPHYLARFGSLFLGAHRIAEGAELANDLLQSGRPVTAVRAMAAELCSGPGVPSKGDDEALGKLLTLIAEESEVQEPSNAADDWIFAAHRRVRTSPVDAVTSFQRAATLRPQVRSEPSWLAGLAGAAHEAGQLDLAINAYRSVVEIDRDPELLAALGDSLLVAGRFQESADAYAQSSPSDKLHPKWLPSRAVASHMAAVTAEGWPAALSAAGVEVTPDDIGDLPLAIAYARAWFNRGVAYTADNNYEDALYCFLAAVVLFPGDDESWVDAALCAINVDEPHLVAGIVTSGYEQRGYALLDEFLSRTSELPFDVRASLMAIIGTVASGEAFAVSDDAT